MPAYRLLLIKDERLEMAEELEADNDLLALEKAASLAPSDALLEVWRNGSRLARFKPARSQARRAWTRI